MGKNYVTILEDLTDKYTLYFIDFGYNFLFLSYVSVNRKKSNYYAAKLPEVEVSRGFL